MGSTWHTQGHLHITEKAGTLASIPAHHAPPTLDFGCLLKALSGYPWQEEQLLSAAEQQEKPTSVELTNHIALATLQHLPTMVMKSQSVPIYPISLHTPTKHLPSHRGDIAGIPGRELPAPLCG